MNINQAFPSNYLKASDLGGKEHTVKVGSVEMHTLGDEEKPVLMFQGKQKGMVLNKTNATILSDAFGPETDAWAGEEIILYSAKVQFQSRMVDGLRIRIASKGNQPAAAAGDDIPF